MDRVQHISVHPRSLEPLTRLYGDSEEDKLHRTVAHLKELLRGATVWNVNSTARGGGVAEMLQSLVAYARGIQVDCRWVVIGGEPAFFRLTKGLHNALHGFAGEDLVLQGRGREEYERVAAQNGLELLAMVRPDDVVILHDPQTLGLAPILSNHGARVIWRCHIGTEHPNRHSRAAFRFLAPYFRYTKCCVFTRSAYVPPDLPVPTRIIAPTIDPLAVKNQYLSPDNVRAILVHTGLFEGPAPDRAPEFTLNDGSLGRVCRAADIIRLGRACSEGRPYVVQVSRWDRLKDHLGVLHGFAHYIEQGGAAHLVLAGPNVHAVADDPEGAEVFDEVLAAYRALPHGTRACIELANLPMADTEENAAIVNALQRQAAVVVQKSLSEGFGLTVSEAMWKAKPVIATRVGGIVDQIEDGVSGILLDDPRDHTAFSKALSRVIADPALASRLGTNARARVQSRFLSLHSLYQYAELIEEIVA